MESFDDCAKVPKVRDKTKIIVTGKENRFCIAFSLLDMILFKLSNIVIRETQIKKNKVLVYYPGFQYC